MPSVSSMKSTRRPMSASRVIGSSGSSSQLAVVDGPVVTGDSSSIVVVGGGSTLLLEAEGCAATVPYVPIAALDGKSLFCSISGTSSITTPAKDGAVQGCPASWCPSAFAVRSFTR